VFQFYLHRCRLHQLLLEERIENGYSNPARLVKLKKRQLNGPSVEGKSGKSYMEKFLETPSPDYKMICETSIFPLPVKPTSDDTGEAGIKVLEISSFSPLKKSTGRNESTCPSPNEQEFEINQFPEEVGETNGDLVMVKEQITAGVTDEMSFNDVKVSDETELAINEQKKIENSLNRYHSDDVTSEVDNYMDALTTMESELETDDEYKPKRSFLKNQKVTDTNIKERRLQARFSDSQSFGDSSTSDDNSPFKQERNEENIEVKARLSDSHSTRTSSTSDNNSSFRGDEDEHVELQTHFSDSQSTRNSSTSDVNSSSKKDKSYFPHSDSLSTVVENIQSEPILFTTSKHYESEIEGTPSNQLPKIVEFQNTDSRKFVMHDDVRVHEEEASDSGKTYSDLLTSGKLSCSDLEPTKPVMLPAATQSDETVSDNDADRAGLVESVVSKPSSPFLIKDDTCPVDSFDKISLDNLVDDDPHIHSHDLLHVSNGSPEDSLCPSIEEPDLNSGLEVVHGDEITGSRSSVDQDEGDGHFKNPSSPRNHMKINGDISEIVESKVQPVPSVDSAENDVGIITCPASGMICSPSRSLSNQQDLFPAPSDSYQIESNEVELTQIFMDSNTEMSKNQLVPSSDITSSDIIHPPVSNLTKSEESLSAFANPNDIETEVHEAVARDSSTVLEGKKLVFHPKIVSEDVQMNHNKSVPCDLPDLENNIEKSSPRAKIQQTGFIDDVKMVPEFSAFDTRQAESTSYGQNDLLQNDKNSFSSPPYNQFESETYLEPHLQSQLGEKDGEFPLKHEKNFASEKSQSQQIYRLKQEGTHAPSESVSEIPADESSSVHSSPGSSGLEINSTQYAMDPLKSLLPDLSPKETENKLDEMPPMPPLPPMQWRMGKVQHASIDSHRDNLEVHQASVQSMQPIMPDKKSQFGLPASDGETLFYQNPFSPVMPLESDMLRHSSAVGVSGHPVALPLQFPLMVNEANGQYNYLVMDRNQIQNPFLTLPMVATSIHPPHGYIVASEGEMVQTSNPYAPILPAAYTLSGDDSTPPQAEPFQHLTQLKTETSADHKTPEQPIHNVVSRDGPPNSHVIASEGEMVHDSSPFLPIPPAECANSGQDSITPIENVTQSPSQVTAETSSDDTTLPQSVSNVISIDKPPHSDIVTSEEEMVQSSNPCPPILSAESSVSEHDSISPQEKITQSPSQLLTETSSEIKTPNHSVSNVEEEQRQLGVSLMLPPNLESVELNQTFQPFEGGMSSLDPSAQTSEFESERINVKSRHKIPRPRNPLIDAVAAHDKSMVSQFLVLI